MAQVLESTLIHKFFLTGNYAAEAAEALAADPRVTLCGNLAVESTKFLRQITPKLTAKYTMVWLSHHRLQVGYRAIDRMLQVAENSIERPDTPFMLYTDRYDANGPHPVIDYQEGALRDDFDFGSLLLFSTSTFPDFLAARQGVRYKYAAWYALRLFVSQQPDRLVHLREPLYTETETDLRTSGQKQFDYVNPANREVQLEMERAVTEHLKTIGAWLAPDELDDATAGEPEDWPVTASVISPVRNRVRTIRDIIGYDVPRATDHYGHIGLEDCIAIAQRDG